MYGDRRRSSENYRRSSFHTLSRLLTTIPHSPSSKKGPAIHTTKGKQWWEILAWECRARFAISKFSFERGRERKGEKGRKMQIHSRKKSSRIRSGARHDQREDPFSVSLRILSAGRKLTGKWPLKPKQEERAPVSLRVRVIYLCHASEESWWAHLARKHWFDQYEYHLSIPRLLLKPCNFLETVSINQQTVALHDDDKSFILCFEDQETVLV